MRLEAQFGEEIGAGQFAHLRVEESSAMPLLRRPLSFWDAGPGFADVLFAVRGQGTRLLARKRAGDIVGMLGPLGNRLSFPPPGSHAVMVAGGVGIVPFFLFSKQILRTEPSVRITLLFGARRKEELYGLEWLRTLPIEIRLATEDGSEGARGRVTYLLEELLKGGERPVLYGCGPDAMLRAVAGIAARENLSLELSLETRMACGLGACRACVIPVRDGDGWRYSRVCCEGPNYRASDLRMDVLARSPV